MKNRIINSSDHHDISQLVESRSPSEPYAILADFIKNARLSDLESDLEESVSLGDQVTLVSATNPKDDYEVSIVLPKEANIDEDRLSLISPIGLAIIGRKVGDLAIWETHQGEREMVISTIRKRSLTIS